MPELRAQGGSPQIVSRLDAGLALTSVPIWRFRPQRRLYRPLDYNYRVADLGKLLIVIGAVMVGIGVVLALAGRTHLPFGRLPGDFIYRGKNTTFYFPLATSILLSVVLSVLFYVIGKFRQ